MDFALDIGGLKIWLWKLEWVFLIFLFLFWRTLKPCQHLWLIIICLLYLYFFIYSIYILFPPSWSRNHQGHLNAAALRPYSDIPLSPLSSRETTNWNCTTDATLTNSWAFLRCLFSESLAASDSSSLWI